MKSWNPRIMPYFWYIFLPKPPIFLICQKKNSICIIYTCMCLLFTLFSHSMGFFKNNKTIETLLNCYARNYNELNYRQAVSRQPEAPGSFPTWVFGYVVFKQAALVAEGLVADLAVQKMGNRPSAHRRHRVRMCSAIVVPQP